MSVQHKPTYHDGSNSQANSNISNKDYPAGSHIIPGMIDMHIHGSHGADVMDATPEALQTIADALLEQGTTAFLATTMTATPEKIEQVLMNVAEFAQQQTHGAKVVGVHLEGPFLAAEFIGAQRRDLIMAPDLELFKHWQNVSNNIIKMVTIAPELANAIEFIEYLTQENIIASFGHSAANYQQTNAAIDAGISHATHLFNAMRGIHHRKPGAVTALLLRDEVYTEIIADNRHLSPSIIDLTYRTKSAQRMLLVTDAVRAQCMKSGEYELGGQKIIVKDKTVRLEDGTLAGSIVTLAEAMQNVLAATHCSMNDLVKMTSLNPAHQLGIKPEGFVVLDDKLNVLDVLL